MEASLLGLAKSKYYKMFIKQMVVKNGDFTKEHATGKKG